MATPYPSEPSASENVPSLTAEIASGFQEFLRRPFAVGSAFPASRWLIKAMLAPVNWAEVESVVELGPGTGGFTRELLRRLPSHASLLAIDTGKPFIEKLTQEIPDSRLMAVHGEAENLSSILTASRIGRVDAIISGIPFSTLSPGCAQNIIASCELALKPRGRLLIYQMRCAVEGFIIDRFDDLQRGSEWRNIPPCRLYWAKKRNDP